MPPKGRLCRKSVDCICVGLVLDALICAPFPVPRISLPKSLLQETGILSQPWVGNWAIDWGRENSSCHWRWLKPSEKIYLQKKKKRKKKREICKVTYVHVPSPRTGMARSYGVLHIISLLCFSLMRLPKPSDYFFFPLAPVFEKCSWQITSFGIHVFIQL